MTNKPVEQQNQTPTADTGEINMQDLDSVSGGNIWQNAMDVGSGMLLGAAGVGVVVGVTNVAVKTAAAIKANQQNPQ
jgi:hypothetical protein